MPFNQFSLQLQITPSIILLKFLPNSVSMSWPIYYVANRAYAAEIICALLIGGFLIIIESGMVSYLHNLVDLVDLGRLELPKAGPKCPI